jgi:hypothetical protein
MTKPTSALSASVVLEFCNLCQWTYEVWLNHLELFDGNPRLTGPRNSYAKKELNRLSIISQEYGLLQLFKPHDKAVMNGNITLGIDYMLKYGGWSNSLRPRLEALAKELNDFANQLRSARNKILSHHDLETIVAGASLGKFAKGDDEKYFKTLQKFVNMVHGEVIGGPWPFSNQVKNDVTAFLIRIKW